MRAEDIAERNFSIRCYTAPASDARRRDEARRLEDQSLRAQGARDPRREARCRSSSSRRARGTPDTTVPRYNPLNKVPALVMDDGESIYDSRVICEYLDAISGGGLLPAEPGRARARAPRRGARRRHRRRRHHGVPRAQARGRAPGPGMDLAPARQGEGRASRRSRRRWARSSTWAAIGPTWPTSPAPARCSGPSSACPSWAGARQPAAQGAGPSAWRRVRRSPLPGRASARLADHAPAEAHLAAVEHRGLARASPPTAARRTRARSARVPGTAQRRTPSRPGGSASWRRDPPRRRRRSR